MRSARAAFFVAAVLASVSTSVGAEARRFALPDLDHIVHLEGAQISPDGKSVAVVVARVNLAENRHDPELLLVDTQTGKPRVLVGGRAGLAHPTFSPQGDAIAFLAEAAGGAAQIHLLRLDGGEPRALTAAPEGVQRYAWRPDGAALAFTTPDSSEPKSGADRFKDAFEVGRNGYLERAAPKPSHLWMVPAEGGPARRVTAGGFSLATSLGASPLSFSPDGRLVTFARTITPRSGDSDSARVHVADTGSGLQQRVTLRTGHEHAPAFSPDGLQLVFLHPKGGDPANATEAFMVPATGGDGRSATAALDRSIAFARFAPDGRSLLVGGSDGGRMALWMQPFEGAARKLDLGPVAEYDDVSVARTGALSFVGTEPGRPSELYVMDSATSAPRRITDYNGEIAALTLGRTETLTWPTDDGLTADGVVTFPPDFTASRAWPLVLLIHGGPTAASNEAFEPLAQLMAAKGWIVLQPNYRGSDNLGNAFQHAIAAGAGEGPGRDVMAGVAVLQSRGWVDPSRIAVSGWSYGGFMTGWLISRYPDTWRAAVMGAAALDLFDMWSLSDLNAQPRHAFTDSPWAPGREAHFREESPLSHVANVRTPTLMLSNVADARVAITQSYKFFQALRDNSVNVRFFAYPTGGHMPLGPVRQKDVYGRWIEWIEGRFSGGP